MGKHVPQGKGGGNMPRRIREGETEIEG